MTFFARNRVLKKNLFYSLQIRLSEPSDLSDNDYSEIIRAFSEHGLKRAVLYCTDNVSNDRLSDLLTQLKNHNIHSVLCTCGNEALSLGNRLNLASSVLFRIQGSESINDRGFSRGAFSSAVRAMEYCSSSGIFFSILTDITSFNVRNLDEMIQLAGIYKTFTGFQISKSSPAKDNVIFPSQEDFSSAVASLIKLKTSAQSRFIRNSLSGLLHISSYPDYRGLSCGAGKLFLTLRPDGTFTPCEFTDIPYPQEFMISYRSSDWKNRLFSFSFPDINRYCSGCGLCGETELNFYFNNRYLPLLHLYRL